MTESYKTFSVETPTSTRRWLVLELCTEAVHSHRHNQMSSSIQFSGLGFVTLGPFHRG